MRFITLLASMPLLAVAFRPSGSSLLLRRTNRAHRLVAHTLSSSEGGIVSFKAAEQDLLEQVASNTTRSTSFQAYVTRRRPMGSALTFLDLVSSDPDAREMQAVLKKQAFEDPNPLAFAACNRVVYPGALVRVTGVAGRTRTVGEALVVVSHLSILAPPPLQGGDHPVASLIRGVRQGALSASEVAAAMNLHPSIEEGGAAEGALLIGSGWSGFGRATSPRDGVALPPPASTDGGQISPTRLLDQLLAAHPGDDIAAAMAWRAAVQTGLLPRPKPPPPHFAEIARRPLLPRKFTPDASVVAHVHARVAEASFDGDYGSEGTLTVGEGDSAHAAWRSELNAVDELNVANALLVCDSLGIDSDDRSDVSAAAPSAAPAAPAWLGGMHNGSDLVKVTGWVQGRRRFGGGAALLDLCDAYASTLTAPQDEESTEAVGGCARNATALGLHWSSRLRCVLHSALFQSAENNGVGKTSSPSSGSSRSSTSNSITSGSTSGGGDTMTIVNSEAKKRIEGHSVDQQKRRSLYAGSAPVSAASPTSSRGEETPTPAALSAYSEVCAPGARVRLWGVLAAGKKFSTTREKENDSGGNNQYKGPSPAVAATVGGNKEESEVASERRLWVVGAELLQASWQPKSVGRLLEMVDGGAVSEFEARAALNLVDNGDGDELDTAVEIDDGQEVNHGKDLPTFTSSSSSTSSSTKAMAAALFGPNIDAKTRAWHVRDLSRQLQSSATRMGTLREGDAVALADTAALRARWPVQEEQQLLNEQLNLDDHLETSPEDAKFAPSGHSNDQSMSEAATSNSSSSSSSSASSGTSASTSSNVSSWGPQRRGVWFKSKKQPQVEWMLDQVQPFVVAHRAKGTERPLQVLDVGGGKGNLASAIAKRFGSDVQVRVVDVMANAIEAGKVRAARQGLSNVAFTLGDASQWTAQPKSLRLRGAANRAGIVHEISQELESKEGEAVASSDRVEDREGGQEQEQEAAAAAEEGVDLVVALHACGSLSDVAMAQAVRHQAGFLVCPCCYLANQNLRVPVPSASSWSSRAAVAPAGTMTGQLACSPCKPSSSSSTLSGSDSAPPQTTTSGSSSEDAATIDDSSSSSSSVPTAVSPSVWLGVSRDKHLSLLRAAELQGDSATAAEAMHAVAALRAEATRRHWQEGWASTADEEISSGEREGSGEEDENEANIKGIKVAIKQFPLAYSTRNLCIVGVPE